MMTIHNDLPKQIHEAQGEAMKRKNVKAENLGRLIKPIFEFRLDGTRCFRNRVWLPRYGGLRVLGLCMSPHKSKYSIHPDQIRCNKDLKICWVFVAANEKRILATYVNHENKIVNESLSAELERYKERVKMFEQRLNVDLNSREKFIDSKIDDMIRNRNAKFAAFE
ncbi:hypothetical protein Tco_0657955 [Tanacetum coccineum]